MTMFRLFLFLFCALFSITTTNVMTTSMAFVIQQPKIHQRSFPAFLRYKSVIFSSSVSASPLPLKFSSTSNTRLNSSSFSSSTTSSTATGTTTKTSSNECSNDYSIENHHSTSHHESSSSSFMFGSYNNQYYYTIERVQTKQRALDALVFRGFSLSVQEYRQQQQQQQRRQNENKDNVFVNDYDKEEEENGGDDDYQKILNHLMKDYDNQGQYIHYASLPVNERPVEFVAVYHNQCPNSTLQSTMTNNNNSSDSNTTMTTATINNNNNSKSQPSLSLSKESLLRLQRQNGVVGFVSAQIRRRTTTTTSTTTSTTTRTTKIDDNNHNHDNHENNNEFIVYLANMGVDPEMRRQRIGTNLLRAVQQYAQEELLQKQTTTTTIAKTNNNIHCIHLTVENTNIGAIQLYQQNGYQYLERNDEYGIMYKNITTTTTTTTTAMTTETTATDSTQ